MGTKIYGKPVEILLVEDNPSDVHLTKSALNKSKIKNNLSVVHDGEEALAFLHRKGRYADSPRPSLILMDLNMPRMNGRELLGHIKQDPNLKMIPVIVLTTSNDETDILESYKQYANCYLCKPVDLGQFMNVVEQIEDFWRTVVHLPPHDPEDRNAA